MSAWLPVEDEQASHAAPPAPDGEPEQRSESGSGRPPWLAPLLTCTAVLLIAVVMVFVVPSALGAGPGGGCGGG